MNKRLIKAKILLKQNSKYLLFLLIWYTFNIILISYFTDGNLLEALAITFYFQDLPGPYGIFYPMISELIIFGIIITILVTDFYRRYNPKQTAEILAEHLENHTIIIGYSHLGQQIRDYLVQKGENCVVIEPNEELVQNLIAEECPVIVRAVHNEDVLKSANLDHAKLVITTRNDLETLIVSTGLIRDQNKYINVICRCFDDSIAKILETTYNCKTISTSKYATEYILNEIDFESTKRVVIIGFTNVTRRIIAKLKKNLIQYTIIDRDRENFEDLLDQEPIIIGDAKDEENLKEAEITKADKAIVLVDRADEVLIISDKIKKLNSKCELICRFFHEDVGEILGKPPFNAKVISQSQHALEQLIQQGAFQFKRIKNL